ncbi:site-specific DNA-methyltransferase [Paraflavisolibacter sp. H34]|uniref:site-specific DNA-methyltransferase n=1 Tax=Huijunlia imazamoxiresistens TaxID=3127457 RepID=UPI00301A350B
MSKIDSIKYKSDKRAHIPSKEEAGMENANLHAKQGTAQYPLNPVVHRGQDPELLWLNKYGNDNREELLKVDIRSLYRHEHISPELLINNLYKIKEGHGSQLDMFSIFGNTLQMDILEKVPDYYKYSDDWKNRLIQGDSLLVMASLLEREGMAGKVQTIYMDPPYGIKYGSNWQMKLNSRDVKDGSDDHLTGEPEMIKAFRDTWELGIHSYLSYLRDRLLAAKELLTESGSCFVQISDENAHLVRNLMDEVFGSENFVSAIKYTKTASQTDRLLASVSDTILWFSKNKEVVKFRALFHEKNASDFSSASLYNALKFPDGTWRRMTAEEKANQQKIPKGAKIFRIDNLTSQTPSNTTTYTYNFEGIDYNPGNRGWSTNINGMRNLEKLGRLIKSGSSLAYIRYLDDFPVYPITNLWTDTGVGSFTESKVYVVQSGIKAVQRCILMTSDPGDLILDPTCGSGTSAYIAEQWGRRWITIDTSRIALNIAKTRLMTATFPYYKLYDTEGKDIRQGFHYNAVSRITLKSLANNEPAEKQTLYDKADVDEKKLRVTGPFTVETLQNFEPASPEALDKDGQEDESIEHFENRIFEHLKSAGVKNGIKNENAIFKRVEHKSNEYLHAEGFYNDVLGNERKAYIHIGPKFGTVSKEAVSKAVKECQMARDADWLIILGFSFESDIQNSTQTTSLGTFEVTKVRMHDDLMQEGLLKKDKKAASFVTIGEPDIKLNKADSAVTVEIQGLDIYDPIKDEVKGRSVADIAYWMVDDDYDSSNFIVKQVFFCGGEKDEFEKWKKGLSSLAKESTKANLQNTLHIELDEDAFDRLYGFKSHPIEYKKGKKIAVRVISQFGEESMKVMTI